MTQPKLLLLKIGGSVITDKDQPMTLRRDDLKRVITEIAKANKELQDTTLILGHGHGSFGHVPLQKYQAGNGYSDESSWKGLLETLDMVSYLNQIVVHECLMQNLRAVACRPNQWVMTKNNLVKHFDLSILDWVIQQKLLPVVCGDMIFDQKKGWVVWSTEKVFDFLAQYYQHQGFQVEAVHVSEVDGFLDSKNQLVPHINLDNWSTVQADLRKNKTYDGTGGMKHKIEECLELTKIGIQSVIINGMVTNNLYNFLTKKTYSGTLIN